MFNFKAFGRYIPGNSFLHRVDPRVKFVLLIAYIACLFLLRKPLALLAAVLFLALLYYLARISPRTIVANLKPLLPLLCFAFLLNVASADASTAFFTFYFINIGWESISQACLLSLRVSALILASNLLLTMSSSALQLCDAFAYLFRPLRYLGVPVQDLAMMMSIALRFVPSLMEECDSIMKAQSSRGANYDSGSFRKRLRGLMTVLVPLFISSFRRAEDLALAMEARLYRNDAVRGKLHPLRLGRADAVLIPLFITVFSLIVAYDLL